jgi:signal transduction histidine kinase
MVVPLFVRGRVVGAVSFVSAESGRRYGPTDLAFAQELARRAGTAIEHAFAFRDSREANRVKDEFLAVVSHELRTPLNAILGWATLMRTHRAPDEDRALRTIERNARSLARLVDDVLDVSRIASGKLELDVKKLDLAAVLKECLEVTAPAARAKEIVVESSIEVDPCPLEGDAERLRQILWNLLSNAVKFTPNGGRIAVVLARRGGCVDVSVSDTGKGIPPELLPHVFERFRQGDSSAARAHGGLGLGLAIARQLAEFHGGTSRAESAGAGKGARFTLTLPMRAATRDRRAPPEPAAISERAAQGPAAEPSASERRRPLDGVRVLVCEDDADSRELLASVLGSAGASLCVVGSASETLDRLPRFHPDVLVSDIGLPDIDGYQLAERMRHLPPEDGGQTPAIAVSAYARSDDARRALLAGYQEHIAKPVDPVQLVGKVRTLSGRFAA